jgi:phosphoglycolate phosphatase
MKKNLIFDFDGVLVDSLDFWFFINQLAAKLIGKKITKKQYLNSFLGNIHSGLNESLNLNAKEAKEFFKHKHLLIDEHYNSKKVVFFPFAKNLIKKLAKDFDLYIVTSSPEHSVNKLLEKQKLTGLFKRVYGLNKNGKRHILKKLALKTPDFQTLFITDTIGDIVEGKAADMQTVGVTWGFHNPKQLKSAQPNFLISKPEALMKILLK